MSKIEILHNEMTTRGRLVQTKRVWKTYADGQIHNVTIYTDSCINSRSTFVDKDEAYNRTIYQCECGRSSTSWRRPTKKYLLSHNSWWTKEQSDSLARALGADIK